MKKLPEIHFTDLNGKARDLVPYIDEIVPHEEDVEFTLVLTYTGEKPLNNGDSMSFHVYITRDYLLIPQ